jgi:cytochrome P450 family 142 subfamily A polypeptide 1
MQVDLMDAALYMGDPSPTYAWLRENDPCHWDPINGLWGITRHADIVAIERNPTLWSSAAGTRPLMTWGTATESMIDVDNPRHAEQKHLVAHQFSRRAVKAMEAEVRSKVNELIDGFASRGHADLVEELAAPLPADLICEKLGFEREMWKTLRHWGDMVNNLGDGVRYHHPNKIDALMRWRAYAPGVLADKSVNPTDDLMTALVQARLPSLANASYSPDGIVDETLLLLVGGSDTTRSSISVAMWELSQDQRQWQYLREDPTRLVIAVEEFVRWATPVLNMCRTATADTTLHGKQVRTGDKVLLMYGAANRDPAVFGATAETFDVARFPNPHIGFGFGTHLCLGINLAKMEIRVCFEELLRRLPDIHVEPGFTPTVNETAFVRGYTALPVAFTPQQAG